MIQAPNLNAFNQGYASGQGMVQDVRTRNALMGYDQNPDQAINGLMGVNPELAFNLRAQRDAQAQAQRQAQIDAEKQAYQMQQDQFSNQINLNEDQRAQAKAQIEAGKYVAGVLLGMPQEQRLAWVNGAGAQYIDTLGVDRSMLDESFMSDQTLHGLYGDMDKAEKKIVVTTPYGVNEYDPNTGAYRSLDKYTPPSVVTKGMPSKARGNGGGRSSGSSGLPAGFVLD